MNIDVTIINENEFLDSIKKELRKQARLAIMDDPNRQGKKFAAVTFDLPTNVMLLYLTTSRIEYV